VQKVTWPKILYCLAVLAGALFLLSCQRETRVDASQALARSFQAVEPEVKQAIDAATRSLKTGNYLEAARALNPVVSGRKLTPEQREAIGLTLQQMNRAIDANPALDSKEMYELRNTMFRAAAGGGSRF
jgi:hypothetical protein